MDSNTNALLERAQALAQTTEHDLPDLHMGRAKEDYAAQDFSNLTESSLFLNPSDPTVVAQDLASQISFVKKLKFNYLEQNAKGRYIRTIISDVDPGISQETYDELQASNALQKSKLKEAKTQLSNTYQEISKKAPEVSLSLSQLKEATAELNLLTSQILDAQLSLSRLRTRYPQPRLTVSQATTIADEQVVKMQLLEEEMQSMEARITKAREKNKAAARELERLRIERNKVEHEFQSLKGEGEEDGRITELYEWFTAALALHKSLLSINSITHPTSNSIHVTYMLPKRVTVELLFQPGTRKLANANLVEPPSPYDEMDIEDLVSVYVMNGDVQSFLAVLLPRLKAKVS